LLFFATARFCFAQAGSLDSAFVPALEPGADVYALALQPDGKILVGGSFVASGAIQVTNLARLNPDGSLDASFDPGVAVPAGYVNAIAVQPDHRIVVGGLGSFEGFVIRLNSDGTQDPDFNPGLYIDSAVNTLVLQPDGKIVIGGQFVVVEFALRRNIARLFADGTLDDHFDACVAASDGSGATSLALQADGSIIAAGNFSFSTGFTRSGIARLLECGNLDPDYAPEPGVDSTNSVFVVRLRPDNTLLFGGNFREYHSTPRGGLAQLASDGTVDFSFQTITGIDAGRAMYSIVILQDGAALVAGNFTTYGGSSRQSVARIRADGTLDEGYHTGVGANNSVSSLLLQGDGGVIVGGKFSRFDGAVRNALCRLKAPPIPPRLNIVAQVEYPWIQTLMYGESGTRYSLQASTNLVDWLEITNFVAASGKVIVSDAAAKYFDFRFYRALAQ